MDATGRSVKRVEVGKPGEFDAKSREEKERRVLEIAARRGLKLAAWMLPAAATGAIAEVLFCACSSFCSFGVSASGAFHREKS